MELAEDEGGAWGVDGVEDVLCRESFLFVPGSKLEGGRGRAGELTSAYRAQGPLTEELVFRSCIVAVSLLAGFSKKEIVFLTPLYFGFGASWFRSRWQGGAEALIAHTAHVHHAWGVYVAGGKTKLSLQRGILSSSDLSSFEPSQASQAADRRPHASQLSNSATRPSSDGTPPSSSCEPVFLFLLFLPRSPFWNPSLEVALSETTG